MTEKVNTHYVTLFVLLDFKRLLELCGASYETPRPIVYAVKFGQKKGLCGVLSCCCALKRLIATLRRYIFKWLNLSNVPNVQSSCMLH